MASNQAQCPLSQANLSSENAHRMPATLHLLFILKQYIMLSFWPSDISGHLSCAGITCPCQEKCDLSKVR